MYILLVTAYMLSGTGEPTPRMTYQLTATHAACIKAAETTQEQLEHIPGVVAWSMDCQEMKALES